jgi:hypothetical protein
MPRWTSASSSGNIIRGIQSAPDSTAGAKAHFAISMQA